MTVLKTNWRGWWPLVIASAGVLAYAGGFGGPFVFDDRMVLLENPRLPSLWPLPLTSRFLVDWSFRVTYALSGWRPADYRVVNVVVHIATAWLAYGVIRRALATGRAGLVLKDGSAAVAGVCATVWVAHPLATEAVTYVAQRYESMMGFFLMASVYAFARAEASDRPRRWHDLALGACLLGMACKEVMVAAPILIVGYDRLFRAGSWREAVLRRGKVHAAMFACWPVLALLYLSSYAEVLRSGTHALGRCSAWSYLSTQAGVIAHYLRLSLWPYPLCFDYAWPIVRDAAGWVGPALVVGGLAVATVAALRRGAAWAYPGVWFFVLLAPTSSIMPLDDPAVEHRMYLPLLAVIVVSIAGAHALLGRLARRGRMWPWLETVLTVGLVGALVLATRARNADYRSAEALWESVVRCRPGNPRAAFGLGAELLAQGRHEEAEDHLRRALALCDEAEGADPGLARTVRSHALNAMGALRFEQGRLEEAERCFVASLREAEANTAARTNLALVRTRLRAEPGKPDAEEVGRE